MIFIISDIHVLFVNIDLLVSNMLKSSYENITKCTIFNHKELKMKIVVVSEAWVALEQILFVLPKIGSKLELFLMRPLRTKFGKIGQWTKKIKDAVVYGWGRQIFPESPKENRNSFNMSTACLFKKIDGQYACTRKHLYKSVLSELTQFSLVVWHHVRPENEPQKNWSVPIILDLSDRPKKKIRPSATHA